MLKPPSLNIGIEEEYQIVDPQTRGLKSYITQLLEDGKMVMMESMKPELHQSMVEVGTNVCNTPAEARAELIRLRRGVMELAAKSGLKIVAAGTHPFSKWIDQDITPLERYMGVKQDMAELAQQLLIFGTHVHIGIEDLEFRVDAMNVARYMMPHVLALSTSSPFWTGRNTGLKSYRSIIFRNFPRSGFPPYFSSWSEFENFVNTLVRVHAIPDGTKLWWDARLNPRYPTLEFRVCDVCTRVDEAVCIAAIFQAIVYKLWKLRRDNLSFRMYPQTFYEENKWRAVRYGIDGNMIDWGKQIEAPAKDLIRELIEWFIGDVLDELGTRKEVEYAFKILAEGTSADRQLKIFNETGSLDAVVDNLIKESEEGVW